MINSYIDGINGDETADLGFDTYFIDASSNDINLTLPNMSSEGDGKRYVLKRVDSNALKIVTIIPDGTTIDGKSSITIGTGQNFVLLYYNGIWQLTVILGAQTPTWIKIKKSHTDFQAAALSNDIEIYELPEGGMIHGAFIKPSTQFAGTGIVAYSLSIGIIGNLIKYAPAFSVITAVSDTNFQLTQNFYLENWGTATSIRANAISAGANLNQSTQGDVEFYLQISTLKY